MISNIYSRVIIMSLSKKKLSENFPLLVVKFSIYFDKHVFVMSLLGFITELEQWF